MSNILMLNDKGVKMRKFLIFVIAAALILPASAQAATKRKPKYEVVEVTSGGTIKGKIKTGVKVSDPSIHIKIKAKENPLETKQEKDTCGENQKAFLYEVSPAGEVKNALVIVENVKKGKAPPKADLTINNVKCRFTPLVGIAYVKSNYVIKNSDPLLHNTSIGKILKGGVRRTVYNLALPYKDQVITKPNRVAGLLNVKCDAHPWMRAYIYSSRHPYVAITDESGNFEIKDLLPGTYSVRIWHEGFEDIVKEVQVGAGKTAGLNETFSVARTPEVLSGK